MMVARIRAGSYRAVSNFDLKLDHCLRAFSFEARFLPEDVMVVLGEAVSFVANVL